MWTGDAGWWWGAAAAGVVLAALALRCRRRRRDKRAQNIASREVHQVHIVRDAFPAHSPRLSRVAALLAPRRTTAVLARAPADKLQSNTQTPTPQIIIIQNSIQNTLTHNSDQNSTQTPQPAPSCHTCQTPSTSTSYKGIPKLPLPEQWLHKRPFDYKYSATIPRPLAQIVNCDLVNDLNQEIRAKKFSATRSPSLEKDDKSPFLSSAKSDKTEVFGFDLDIVNKVVTQPSYTERYREMSEKYNTMSPKDVGDKNSDNVAPNNLRRFCSVSTRLNICSENPYNEGQQEKLMQNSPRTLECSSAKEKSSISKFDFSPKNLADSFSSPRFFTPPETVSPMFFTEPSPKSVYYDTVRSPKFFPETPKDGEVPQSPRALGDNLNRSNSSSEKISSPRLLTNSARPSPKLHSCNKENYFTFDHVSVSEEGTTKMSPRPRRYSGRNSIEKERFTPPIDKEVKKYKRHNSCDTNNKNIKTNILKPKCTEPIKDVTDKDVVDCCAKIDFVHLNPSIEVEKNDLKSNEPITVQVRRERQRLKSISLDSDNARIIEQNLGLPIAKQMKDQMNEAYKNQDISTSCEGMERLLKTPSNDRPIFKFDHDYKVKNYELEEPKSPELKQKKCLRQSSDTQSFLDMPRFSPKEFEITVTTEEGNISIPEIYAKRKDKNLRNLTIDLTKRDSDLEKELLEFEKLYTNAEEKKVKTPTLKIKATSLDSSESVNLSLPQNSILEVPQNSISVPNTPKRQLKKILTQKNIKPDYSGLRMGYNTIQSAAEQRRLYTKDSGIYLRDNHANLMLFQPGTSRMGSRTMGSFAENITDLSENMPAINISGTNNLIYHLDSGQILGSNLINYKPNLSISSTNLKTLPEGVPSDNFEPSVEEEKSVKKLNRRNSNQSLMLSTHSLQSSNGSLNNTGAPSHNLGTVRTSVSNFSLNSDGRPKYILVDRRDSNTSLVTSDSFTSRVACSFNSNISGEITKNCLLQRRGSNNSLTLNIQTSNLSRHSSNNSLNKEVKPVQKKGLLERRSSNTSLTLNITNSNPQLSLVNRGLSISNYNLNGSTSNLSRYNSNQSIDNTTVETRKGILERRSSNTSLTLNIHPQEPRNLDIDERDIKRNLKDIPHRGAHGKSLSTDNLIPKSYKNRIRLRNSVENSVGFGSHDNLWSSTYPDSRNLTYLCGDQENEIIYAFGTKADTNFQHGFIRNITTKPLSPQSTSEDFRLYLANMQHLQNASSVLTRNQLRDLNNVFQNGYSKVKCHSSAEGQHCCSGRVDTDIAKENPQMVIPEPVTSQPCSEYQKILLRNLHQEFWDMPTNFQEKPIVSGSHLKNRYKTILPNEHSRFILKSEAGAVTEGYINANFIKGYEYTKNSYIATQGPLQNTIYDFWLMVYQNCTHFKGRRHSDPTPTTSTPSHGIQKIVMLTNFVENNRQKCEKYFPLDLNEETTFHNTDFDPGGFFEESPQNSFIIKNSGMLKKSGYTVRKLQVQYITKYESETVTVYHYWFHNWADHKCPKDVNALLNLSLDVLHEGNYNFSGIDDEKEELCMCSESPNLEHKFVYLPSDLEKGRTCESKANFNVNVSESSSPPTIVHCSAGIGRTGCLIAILNGIKQLIYEQKVDVLGIVCNMRLNRGGMVQNSEQYELIHKVLCLYEQACLPNL